MPSHPSLPRLPTPIHLAARVRREIERDALRARNGIKLAAGVTRPGVGLTPKDVVWQRGWAQHHARPHALGRLQGAAVVAVRSEPLPGNPGAPVLNDRLRDETDWGDSLR